MIQILLKLRDYARINKIGCLYRAADKLIKRKFNSFD